jgi:hypothetical protein
MNPPNLSAPVKTQPDSKIGVLLRVVFFCATVYLGTYVVGGALQSTVHSPMLVGTLGVFAAGLLANLLTMRIFDRRNLADIGLGNRRGTGRNFLIGIGLGGGAAVVTMLLPLAARWAHFEPSAPASRASVVDWALSLVFYLAMLLFGAVGEETIFRGYAFQLLVEKMGAFATVLPVGVIFGLAHGGNPNSGKLALLNTSLWGVLLGYAFLRSHDLWLPIAMHYSWNAVLPLFGTNLSGYTIEITRYTYAWDVPVVWSGGAYGPEGGLLATIVIAILFYVLAKAPVVPQFAAIATVLNEP